MKPCCEMSSWLVCCVHIRVISMKNTIGYCNLMWTVAAKMLIWSQVLLLLKSAFLWMPTEAETAATETPQCRFLWEFSVRPGMLCTVLEILCFNSNLLCTSHLLMIESHNTRWVCSHCTVRWSSYDPRAHTVLVKWTRWLLLFALSIYNCK